VIFKTKQDLLNISAKNIYKVLDKDISECEQIVQLFNFPGVFTLPFVLTGKRGRYKSPDFLLEGKDCVLGIEVTYAAKQSWEEASNNLLDNSNPGYTTISRNWFIDIEKRGKGLGNYLKSYTLNSWVWGSKEQAKEKANDLIKAIENKSKKFLEPNFEKFDKNWLLVTDKSPFLFLDIEEFLIITTESLKKLNIPFDKVFFITQQHVSKEYPSEFLWFEIKNGVIRQIEKG